MEMRRQVTVSWDSGGSDEAPPKVRHSYTLLCTCICYFFHSFSGIHTCQDQWFLKGLKTGPDMGDLRF